MAHSNPNAPQRPDLTEEVNVTDAHAVFEGATPATIREKRLEDKGMEPVPFWLFLVAGLALLVGGAVAGKGGFFNYSSDSMWASNFTPYDSGEIEVPDSGEVLPFFVKQGDKTFSSKCSGCHGPDGKGDGANYPPLLGSEWVMADNTEALGMIILNGLSGPIDVAGRTWNNGQVMPAQAITSAKELAQLMTYLRSGLNDVGDVVTVEQAQAAVDAYEARGPGKGVTSKELLAGHMKLLPGESMDPTTMIDFETLEPVEAGGN